MNRLACEPTYYVGSITNFNLVPYNLCRQLSFKAPIAFDFLKEESAFVCNEFFQSLVPMQGDLQTARLEPGPWGECPPLPEDVGPRDGAKEMKRKRQKHLLNCRLPQRRLSFPSS